MKRFLLSCLGLSTALLTAQPNFDEVQITSQKISDNVHVLFGQAGTWAWQSATSTPT